MCLTYLKKYIFYSLTFVVPNTTHSNSGRFSRIINFFVHSKIKAKQGNTNKLPAFDIFSTGPFLMEQVFKATFSVHKLIPKNAQMTTLYTNWSLYITFTMIYYIWQE